MFGIFGTVKDLVCKMEIDREKAKYFLEYKGKKYYFCSEDCQKKFDINSDKFVAVQETDASRYCCH